MGLPVPSPTPPPFQGSPFPLLLTRSKDNAHSTYVRSGLILFLKVFKNFTLLFFVVIFVMCLLLVLENKYILPCFKSEREGSSSLVDRRILQPEHVQSATQKNVTI